MVDKRSGVLDVITKSHKHVRTMPAIASDKDEDVIFVLGFAGTFVNEFSACAHMLALPSGEHPALLRAVADPTKRSPAVFRSPATADGDITSSVFPINARQREVLDGLKLNIEGIQGPPGTGKSTVIYHIVKSYLPRHEVALATCVQNMAVDAIVKKLSSSASTPSFVHDNAERLGLKARG